LKREYLQGRSQVKGLVELSSPKNENYVINDSPSCRPNLKYLELCSEDELTGLGQHEGESLMK